MWRRGRCSCSSREGRSASGVCVVASDNCVSALSGQNRGWSQRVRRPQQWPVNECTVFAVERRGLGIGPVSEMAASEEASGYKDRDEASALTRQNPEDLPEGIIEDEGGDSAEVLPTRALRRTTNTARETAREFAEHWVISILASYGFIIAPKRLKYKFCGVVGARGLRSGLDTTGLLSKPETNGRHTSPWGPHGGREPGASAAVAGTEREPGFDRSLINMIPKGVPGRECRTGPWLHRADSRWNCSSCLIVFKRFEKKPSSNDKNQARHQNSLGIVTVRPGRRTAPKPAVQWTVRRQYGRAESFMTPDGTGRWTDG
ncbi:hypothetical protein K438DRAFT_1778357 [Mycena galopus ATCC 62051]|nr:hypothetical protein K438DRAFT_1778357 [Mycena galopus ATCC 62051]